MFWVYQMNNASPLSKSVRGLRRCRHVGAQTSAAIRGNGSDLVPLLRPTLFLSLGVVMRYHRGEKRKGREGGRKWGRGRGQCGLLVKVLLVGVIV